MVFLPDGKGTKVPEGETVLAAAEKAGVHLSSVCGGEGTCGRCRVVLKKGDVQTEPTAFLSPEEVAAGHALACRTRVQSDLLVEVPLESQWESRALLAAADTSRFGQIVPQRPGARAYCCDPLSRKVFLSLPPPTLEDNLSDLDRVWRELDRKFDLPVKQTGLHNLQKLASLLRENHWQVTTTLSRRGRTVEVVDFEPGDTTAHHYGLAVDIGTTTVVVQLIDLNTCEVLGSEARYNSQIRYGADVISRIVYATQNEDGRHKLQTTVVRDVNQLIAALAEEKGIDLRDVTYLTCVGNTTMIHLLLGLEVANIRREPYIPTANYPSVVRAREVGIKINERGLLCCLPGVAAYVGADITAGVLASGLHQSEELALFFDIGTNGEIALGNSDWLVCCSASAGPAFEGGEMQCGMRATAGAIERVILGPDGPVSYEVIGGGRPRGLCGTGFIDCVAELVRAGYLDKGGRFNRERLDGRLREKEYGLEFVLAPAAETDTGRDLVITQPDVDVFIRSKGAVFTAADCLLAHLGFEFTDVDRVYIAGGFGNYLDIRNSIAIGLLPDLPLEKFQFIGNSAITGARMCLLSQEALEEVERIASKMTYFELSTDPKFMSEFTSSLFLPHTDVEKFPSVTGQGRG